MAIVFRPFHLARHFRFYEPFCDFKCGKTEAVSNMERELYTFLEDTSVRRAG
ncbi:MAG: hypothetical protein JNN07_28645 [Verrucomicrobiales bacterium]|nr:hypothetical protein [Verrucomicrobiales bacterium]